MFFSMINVDMLRVKLRAVANKRLNQHLMDRFMVINVYEDMKGSFDIIKLIESKGGAARRFQNNSSEVNQLKMSLS